MKEVNKRNIEEYIPHRKPMVMVDGLDRVTDSMAVSKFCILPENVLVSNGCFSEAGLIENVAQTAAVHAGYWFRQNGKEIPSGYIAAVKDLTITSLPQMNSNIQTTIHVTNQILGMTIVEGRVEQDGKILCRCELKIFIQSL